MEFNKKLILFLVLSTLINEMCAKSVEKPRKRRFAAPISALIIKSGARFIPKKYVLAASVGVFGSTIGRKTFIRSINETSDILSDVRNTTIDMTSKRLMPKFTFNETVQASESNKNSSILLPILKAATEAIVWGGLSSAGGVPAVITDIVLQNKTTDEQLKPEIKSDLKTEPKKFTILSRNRRMVPLLLSAGKAAAWTTLMVAGGVAVTAADIAIREAMADSRLEKLRRRSPDCQFNHFGCIAKRCWANCGPRLTGGDWCLTTKNATAAVIEYATCERDSDCNRCWTCAGDCLIEADITDAEKKMNNPF